jgi:hypothetical protein
MNSTYIFAMVDPCFAFEHHGFLQCKTLNYRIGWATFNTPQLFSLNSKPLWDSKGSNLLELEGDCCMCTSSTILGLVVGTITRGWDKFTRLRQWESLSALGGEYASRLENPKTSFPSRCNRQFVKDNMDM